jgi:hypothetical protein
LPVFELSHLINFWNSFSLKLQLACDVKLWFTLDLQIAELVKEKALQLNEKVQNIALFHSVLRFSPLTPSRGTDAAASF